jgi:transposase
MVRRKFTQGVKLEAVKVIKERGVTVVQAACDLGVHGMVLHWPVESALQPTSRRRRCEGRLHREAPRNLAGGMVV